MGTTASYTQNIQSSKRLICENIAMDREFDVLGQYRAITAKLKRRFLKKPNVSEASGQFGSLAAELKRQDCPHYAGFCSLAKARCENTLSNATGEVEALTEAARLFLQAEKSCVELRCPSFEEHITEAIHLFNQAIKTHCAQGNSALGACLCLEIGDALRYMNRPHEAMVHYQHAAELQHQNPTDALQSMTLVASCKIDSGSFYLAGTVCSNVDFEQPLDLTRDGREWMKYTRRHQRQILHVLRVSHQYLRSLTV